ncbi:proline-rich nuclear receptor coactivator motif-containing protein [Sporobolomyces salmoneus]|uniref:proline-rich nuclear receptor coactivator motif-containing protein n=1 Tax=Sporobolomyces salmoneus TaxID=183962 RepID=UPI0031711E66
MSTRVMHPINRQFNNVPGIINLPPPSSSSSLNSKFPESPRSTSRLVHQSLGEKPTPTVEQSHTDNGESKKRRRQKKSIQPPSTTALEATPEQAPAVLDETVASPSKPRRSRRGRANRQTSPPIPEALLPSSSSASPTDDPSDFSSTTPPQAEKLVHLKSVPPPSHPHQHQRAGFSKPQFGHHSSGGSSGEDDGWDMPTLLTRAGGTGNRNSVNNKVEPKENLSWQQELLRSAAAPSSGSSPRGASTRVTTFESPRSVHPRPTRHSVPTPRLPHHGHHHSHSNSHSTRPVLHPSLSDTTPSSTTTSTTATANSSSTTLNWQQEMLLQTEHLQTSSLSERRQNNSSPTKQSTSSASSSSIGNGGGGGGNGTVTGGGVSTQRQRQQRMKDSITFGLSDLDTSEFDHHHSGAGVGITRRNSLGRRHPSTAVTTPRKHREQVELVSTLTTTPTKQQEMLGPRYAGPTFHNSPAPSSLPVPSFVLRRQT